MVLFFLSSTIGYAQNLILNNSFEDATVLQGQNWYNQIESWWQLGSCDGFSNSYLLDNDIYPHCNYCVPTSLHGFQMPQDGNNFVGFGANTFSPPPPPPNNIIYGLREHFGGYFTEQLKPNIKYSFSFYVSLAEVSNAYSKSLQIKTFTDSVCTDQTQCNTEGTAIWEMDTLITQTTDWYKISFTFTAQGNERAFLIGAFNPTAQLDYQYIPGTDSAWVWDHSQRYFNTYWFLDNFSLTEIIDPVPFEDNLSITNNPGYGNATTQFKVTLNTASTADLFVCDEAGRIIAHHIFTESQEIFSLPQLAGAVYYYTFNSTSSITSDTNVRLEGKIVQY